jgi:hypothetical protein
MQLWGLSREMGFPQEEGSNAVGSVVGVGGCDCMSGCGSCAVVLVRVYRYKQM